MLVDDELELSALPSELEMSAEFAEKELWVSDELEDAPSPGRAITLLELSPELTAEADASPEAATVAVPMPAPAVPASAPATATSPPTEAAYEFCGTYP